MVVVRKIHAVNNEPLVHSPNKVRSSCDLECRNPRDFPTPLHLHGNCACMHIDFFKMNINGVPLCKKMNDFTITSYNVECETNEIFYNEIYKSARHSVRHNIR